jgi:hypothetical protein
MQIIANRAPIGFEAEFANQREETICYRGILMPFSSDSETIDFIYGVINWKHVAAAKEGEQLPEPAVELVNDADELPEVEAEAPLELTDVAAQAPLDPVEAAAEEQFEVTKAAPDGATEPAQTDDEPTENAADLPEAPIVHFSWEDGPLADVDSGELPSIELNDNAELADRLWAARETADAAKAGEGRTRIALYCALSLAYDFALAAQDNPEEYAELLEGSGVKAQARAPMTPIVKLVFGIDYDKARLTEFAAALSFALRQEVAAGGFQPLIEKQAGGLKALVAAERQARRPEPKPDARGEVARARLRAAPPISLADVPAEEEFAVVLTRRGADGRHEPVAILDDETLIERAIRRAA